MTIDWMELEPAIGMSITEVDREAIANAADCCRYYIHGERQREIPMPAEIKKRADAISKQAQKLRDLLCADDPASQYAAEAVRGWSVNLDIHQLSEIANNVSRRLLHDIEQNSGPANTLRTQSRKQLVRIICTIWIHNGGSPEEAKINAWQGALNPHGALAHFIRFIMDSYGIVISDQQIYDDARDAISEVQRDIDLHP